ncbi:MAG: hypothetical protein XD98_0203 [Microgenomates bacterium 39_6]|nr:MAG: hypothetical protein XD98_0203 [Microgenomates bacterium 39_6]
MKQKPLKVGFDMDGVLLYNPARIARPLISLVKRKLRIIDRDELEFFVPKPGFQQVTWDFVHKSSCFIAPGFDEIVKLKEEGLIEPYLITARFAHLEKDFNRWMKKMKADSVFVEYMMNYQDEQPHLFKEKMIKKLELDFFVEDNLDIVGHLNQACLKTKIYWITNLLDNRYEYPNKFLSLKASIEEIKKAVINL